MTRISAELIKGQFRALAGAVEDRLEKLPGNDVKKLEELAEQAFAIVCRRTK